MSNVRHFKKLELFDARDYHEGMIGNAWPQLAALAWQGYLSEGSGIVFIDLTQATNPGADQPGFTVPARYIAADSDEITEIVSIKESPVLARWLDEYDDEGYDPERAVIIGIARLDGTIDFHHLWPREDGPGLTPPDAYEASLPDETDADLEETEIDPPATVLRFPSQSDEP